MTGPAQLGGSPERRTQRERRETTIGKLVDATIEALQEVGYSRATVAEICGRAGVSQGALFRHFATRLDLLVATADEVSRRQVAEFDERFAGRDATPESVIEAMSLIRDRARSPVNVVWHELLHAARTDPELRERVEPALRRFSREIDARGRTWAKAAGYPPERVLALLTILMHYADGEVAVSRVLSDGGDQQDTYAERENQSFALLSRLLADLLRDGGH
ncbi:MAG: TetR family transcriptional regulator [Micromonosporaceae bacterium]|nr:TetR family transcriptional regulator [Micromonosporaceae bacterium]